MCNIIRKKNKEKIMKYVAGSNKQGKYSAIGHIQSSYLNLDSFVACFNDLIA